MYDNNYLSHYGIKGQRWGVRRFQNADGSINRANKRSPTSGEKKETVKKVAKGVVIAAAVVGSAWVAQKYGGRAIRGAKAAKYSAKPTTKAHRVTKARRDMGYYKNYKTGRINLNRTMPTTSVSRGSLFVQNSSMLTQPVSQLTKSTLGL